MSEQPMPELVTVCAICGEHLTTVEWKEQGETSWEWFHGSNSDHDPVPAPADRSEAVSRCDFCAELNPQWLFETTKLVKILHMLEKNVSIVRHDDGAWSACTVCKRLVVKRDLDRLVHRAMIPVRRSAPDQNEDFYTMKKKELRDFQEAFFLAEPGEPEKLNSRR